MRPCPLDNRYHTEYTSSLLFTLSGTPDILPFQDIPGITAGTYCAIATTSIALCYPPLYPAPAVMLYPSIPKNPLIQETWVASAFPSSPL